MPLFPSTPMSAPSTLPLLLGSGHLLPRTHVLPLKRASSLLNQDGPSYPAGCVPGHLES